MGGDQKETLDEKLDLMRAVPLFSECRLGHLLALDSVFEMSFANAGDVLQRRGTYCREWTLVAQGTALASDDEDPAGLPECWVGLMSAGDSWDERSITRQEPCEVSITALESMILLTTDSSRLPWLCDRFPFLGERFLGERLRREDSQVLSRSVSRSSRLSTLP